MLHTLVSTHEAGQIRLTTSIVTESDARVVYLDPLSDVQVCLILAADGVVYAIIAESIIITVIMAAAEV